jgi:hypothetical protein
MRPIGWRHLYEGVAPASYVPLDVPEPRAVTGIFRDHLDSCGTEPLPTVD